MPSDNLPNTADRIQSFIAQRLLDRDGLCRSYIRADTLAPYTHADLMAVDDHAYYWQNHPDKGDCIAYEDALMATSEWMLSQLARHSATHDDSARDAAGRSAAAILAVIDEGRHYMPGYLPKPFGGVAKTRDSHEISPDQYTLSICALEAWRPFASPPQAAAIDRFCVDAADFFIARRWRHAYRHRSIVTAPTHPHALGLFIALPVLAAGVTGDARYLKELAQFDPVLDAAMTDENLANFNMTALLISGFDLALRRGLDNPRVRELIAVLWHRSAAHVNALGEGIESVQPPRNTTQVTRLAALATLVNHYHPQLNTRPVVARILHRLQNPAQFHHFVNADRATFPPGQYWLIDGLCATSMTGWLLAFWRHRAAGVELQ